VIAKFQKPRGIRRYSFGALVTPVDPNKNKKMSLLAEEHEIPYIGSFSK
jgi:hypothetical protein